MCLFNLSYKKKKPTLENPSRQLLVAPLLPKPLSARPPSSPSPNRLSPCGRHRRQPGGSSAASSSPSSAATGGSNISPPPRLHRWQIPDGSNRLMPPRQPPGGSNAALSLPSPAAAIGPSTLQARRAPLHLLCHTARPCQREEHLASLTVRMQARKGQQGCHAIRHLRCSTHRRYLAPFLQGDVGDGEKPSWFPSYVPSSPSRVM
jgi:hypothetical protein